MRTGWIIIAVLAVIVLGILSGVAGLLFAPIIGGIVLVGIIIWLLVRRVEHKPPSG